jgi:hypothetical protein
MIDERFLMHRLKATSLASIVGAVAMGGWFMYSMIVLDERRYDLLAIMLVMAVTKLGALLYYRRTD